MQNQILERIIPWLGAVLVALATAGPAVAQGVEASVGSGPDLATIVLEFEDGANFLFEVLFDESSPTTGLDAMRTLESELPSFELTLINFGFGLVIDGVGYDGHSNVGFGGGERWWHYWTREDDLDPFTFSDVGAAHRLLMHGSWDGWNYGVAEPPTTPPPVVGECGPGYFKNHVPLWDDEDDGLDDEARCCSGAIDASDGVNTECEQILLELVTRGGDAAVADATAVELNECLAPAAPCEASPIPADPSSWKAF